MLKGLTGKVMTHRFWSIASGITLFLCACSGKPTPTADPAWEKIFDGETLSGWTPKISGQPLGEDAMQLFQARDGELVVDYPYGAAFDNTFGHLFFDSSLTDYRLRFEYKFFGEQAEGGPDWAYMNSGVMVHAQAPETMDHVQPFPISIEAQLLGSGPRAPERTTANICTPGTHIVIDGALVTQHCITSRTTAAPAEEWVPFEIEVRGSEIVQLFIAGEAAFTLTDPTYDIDDSDVRRLGYFGTVDQGYFALQAESHPVAFRNIELLRLEPARE